MLDECRRRQPLPDEPAPRRPDARPERSPTSCSGTVRGGSSPVLAARDAAARRQHPAAGDRRLADARARRPGGPSPQRSPGVLSVSIAEGFPYADVAEMGMAFIAVTDGDQRSPESRARAREASMGRCATSSMDDGEDVDDALRTAAAIARARPVVLLDVGDNVGGGSPADSTHVLAAAQRLGIARAVPLAVRSRAVAACVDRRASAPSVELTVGGKTDDLHGDSGRRPARYAHLDDGRFEDPGSRTAATGSSTPGHVRSSTPTTATSCCYISTAGQLEPPGADRAPGSIPAPADHRRQGRAVTASAPSNRSPPR